MFKSNVAARPLGPNSSLRQQCAEHKASNASRASPQPIVLASTAWRLDEHRAPNCDVAARPLGPRFIVATTTCRAHTRQAMPVEPTRNQVCWQESHGNMLSNEQQTPSSNRRGGAKQQPTTKHQTTTNNHPTTTNNQATMTTHPTTITTPTIGLTLNNNYNRCNQQAKLSQSRAGCPSGNAAHAVSTALAVQSCNSPPLAPTPTQAQARLIAG